MLVGIHPTTISDSFQTAAAKSAEILEGMSTPVELTDRESLLQSATTALNSKVCDTSLCVSPFLYLGLTVLPILRGAGLTCLLSFLYKKGAYSS